MVIVGRAMIVASRVRYRPVHRGEVATLRVRHGQGGWPSLRYSCLRRRSSEVATWPHTLRNTLLRAPVPSNLSWCLCAFTAQPKRKCVRQFLDELAARQDAVAACFPRLPQGRGIDV